MKNILLDICLVLLILIMGNQFLNKEQLHQEDLKSSLEMFEKDVDVGLVEEHYRLAKDPKQNNVSRFVEEISDFSRDGVRMMVEVFASALDGF